MDEALEALPVASAAFATGGITSGHVRLLTRVATRAQEGFLVALARRMTVKEFARVVASRVERDGAGAAETVAAGEGDRVRHDVAVPAWVAGWWRDTAVLARRLAGSGVSSGEAFGMVVAEIGAGGVGAGGSRFDADQATGGCEVPTLRPVDSNDEDGSASVCVPAGAPGCREDLPRSAPGAILPQCTGHDARQVDGKLRGVLTERHGHDLDLADHLSRIGRSRGYFSDGFRSLEAYAADHFGLPARSLYRLLALSRALEGLPAMRGAFLEGRLTARQVVLLASVATPRTIDAWMLRAGESALRRLEDEVECWLHLKLTRPGVWKKLDGLPFPAGLSIAPGRGMRLSSSARSRGADPGAGPVPPATFLRALVDDEAATPLPERRCVISLWLEPGVRARWLGIVAEMKGHYGEGFREWQALAIALREFWSVWDNKETRRQRRQHPVLERDGWRCSSPWCSAMGTGRLQVHHVVPRALGGPDAGWNLISLCTACHLGLLHQGYIRVRGRAPDELIWEMGCEPDREPFAVFRGELLVGGSLRSPSGRA